MNRKRTRSETLRKTRVTLTLDPEDAWMLRAVTKANRMLIPGEMARWILAVELRRARREGAVEFVRNRTNETVADYQALKAAAALPDVAPGLASVVSLASWKGKREARS